MCGMHWIAPVAASRGQCDPQDTQHQADEGGYGWKIGTYDGANEPEQPRSDRCRWIAKKSTGQDRLDEKRFGESSRRVDWNYERASHGQSRIRLNRQDEAGDGETVRRGGSFEERTAEWKPASSH